MTEHKALVRKLDALIDKNVKGDHSQYVKATAALAGANASLVEARADIQKVAETIDKIAEGRRGARRVGREPLGAPRRRWRYRQRLCAPSRIG